MKNTWICLLLTLTIALQSFVAVANSNDQHQLDAQHVQTQHSHQDDHQTLYDDATQEQHQVDDCHHCGHCHGSHAQWLAQPTPTQLAQRLASSQFVQAQNNQYHRYFNEINRPPIV